jgi:hypothetical protein
LWLAGVRNFKVCNPFWLIVGPKMTDDDLWKEDPVHPSATGNHKLLASVWPLAKNLLESGGTVVKTDQAYSAGRMARVAASYAMARAERRPEVKKAAQQPPRIQPRAWTRPPGRPMWTREAMAVLFHWLLVLSSKIFNHIMYIYKTVLVKPIAHGP